MEATLMKSKGDLLFIPDTSVLDAGEIKLLEELLDKIRYLLGKNVHAILIEGEPHPADVKKLICTLRYIGRPADPEHPNKDLYKVLQQRADQGFVDVPVIGSP